MLTASRASAVVSAGALVGVRLSAIMPRWWREQPTGWVALTTTSNLTWLATLLHPVAGALAARTVSAPLLFAAEASADVDAHDRGHLPCALAGRNVACLLVSAAGTALLAAGLSVPATALVYTVSGTVLVGVTALLTRRYLRGAVAAGQSPEPLVVT